MKLRESGNYGGVFVYKYVMVIWKLKMIILAPMSLKFQKKVMPRRKTSKKENESRPTLWELCVSGDVDMVREAVQRGDQVP